MISLAPPTGDIELQNYVKWLAENKLEFKILSAGDAVEGILLLSGGADIGKNPDRDELEFGWLKESIDNKIPVLGICRGMQIINYYFGGLVESISELIVENHLVDNFEDDADHHERLSQFHWVTNKQTGTKFVVNSRHHQHCSVLAKNLKPIFYSEDSTIESFVSRKGTPILGVQWHPEREEVKIPFYINSRRYAVNWLKNKLKINE